MMQGVASPAGSEIGIQIRSALPGRYRLYVPGLYRNPELERLLERELNARAARRRASVNVLAATVLVVVPDDEQTRADGVVREVESLVREFAQAAAVSLAELGRRGQERPARLLVNGARKRRGASGDEPWWRSLGSARPALREPHAEAQPAALWHTLEAQQVAALVGADGAGLAEQEAAARLIRYGKNCLPEVARRSALAMFVDQFMELPVALLAGSTVLSMATGGVADGLVILGVIVINGVIGYVTESTAERTIASLTRGGAPEVEVIRAGRLHSVPLEDVALGDLIALRQGSVVPADARLLRSQALTVDESALTGESVPVEKRAHALERPDLPLADRSNMVFRGTLVTGGSGLALVVATGAATQVGQLQSMVSDVQRRETPMQKQLRDLGERTMVLAGAVCGGVFVLGLLRGQPLGAMLRTAVSLAVAAVPEGLPTVAITTLALGIRKMKGHAVLVRRLDAIETLGSVQVLCFDKTGTITHNRMRAVRGCVGVELFELDGPRVRGAHGALEVGARRDLEWLLNVGALCSDAELTLDDDGRPCARGSATEAALVDCAIALGVDVARLRQAHPTARTETRTEERKLMATLHGPLEDGGFVVAVKGSPLEVLDRCGYWLRGGERVALTDELRRLVRRHNDTLAGEALRVLGLAYAEHRHEPGSCEHELVWLGLMGLADPPRPGLPELFRQFRRAGVRSVMITGDQSATAYAVAKQIGLAEDGELRTLDSVELENMDPDVLAELAPRVHVFSRVSPRHKLQIVQALQRSGLVVAMTGDGINDCPALKAADIGVAMGGGSAPVAREVADVILEDDELGSMLTAIEHGRVIHADIKKAVRFILSTNTSEILLTLLSVAAGLGEGMSPLQLLWINLISDIFPELALALQPPEKNVLDQPPRDPGSNMFSKTELRHMGVEGALLTAGAMSAYLYGIRRYGRSPQAQTVSFVALSSAQLLHAFSTRSEKHHLLERDGAAHNPYVPLAVGGGIALTVLMQLLPGARRTFGSTRLAGPDWCVSALAALGPLLANEVVKAARFSRATDPPRLLPEPRELRAAE